MNRAALSPYFFLLYGAASPDSCRHVGGFTFGLASIVNIALRDVEARVRLCSHTLQFAYLPRSLEVQAYGRLLRPSLL
jgi:hypothetical protein